MNTLTIRQGAVCKTLSIQPPIALDDALRQAGFLLPMPCGGHHTCGKCLVRAEGELSPRSPEEERLCPDPSARLACCTFVTGDAQVELPVQEAVEVLTDADGQAPAGNEPVGFGVDVGTTTVAVYLYGLTSGVQLAHEGQLNRQSIFGADVIARIDAARQDPLALQRCILDQLQELFASCLERCNLPWEQVKRLVITGNTTMLHLLTGRNATGIAAAPFLPESLFGYGVDAGTFFPPLRDAALFFPSCISAYVGADIVCAILASALTAQYTHALLVDVGTNGEMALWSAGRLFCCSAAAGPAFEGAGLSSGMTAAPGAITRVYQEDGRLCCQVLGGGAPKGLCGTGALSALAFFLEQGAIDETGRILDTDHPFSSLVEETPDGPLLRLAEGVALTQRDIRQLQLAKAAIAAGIAALLHQTGLEPEQLDALVLCGGFGCRLDPYDAQRIGLLPPLPIQRVLTAGNASGQGAVQLLLHPEQEAFTAGLATQGETLELSNSPWFMDRYVDEMYFPTP